MTLPALIILTAFLAVMIAGPLALWITGLVKGGRHGWNGRYEALIPRSWLAYILAFNITFFIQELFLVLPKAFVPGLNPTLFHNNHDWQGDDPIAELFQGTGALAILLTGLVFLARLGKGQSASLRLFGIWMAYHGLMQGLPQLAVGAVAPGNDTARAMAYLGLPDMAQLAIGIAALALVPFVALRLGRAFLALAPTGVEPRKLILLAATLPALAAIPVILLYRIPREAMEVLAPPILVTWIGIAWIQAGAWRDVPPLGRQPQQQGSLIVLAVAAIALLAVFQLVLRPGIAFF